MTVSDRPREDPTSSELEEAVARILELADDAQPGAFATLRAAHPEHESLLRSWEAAAQTIPPGCNRLDSLREWTRVGDQKYNHPEQVGPYHILDTLGEGGFGIVYLAEQREPVRRRVALKVIKPGMDSKEVLARFEAERQALALMDHPNVASVFETGATERGQSYFAMEHVPGVPITEFCDTERLSTRERIALFVDVCHAVQHAHQKGIIHRDLKPSNILVTLVDGRPVPKVIDFGIAKATSQQLTEKTLYTEAGRMVGTPEYMSPEQAGTTGLDVDTRTDIYSLGVLLYELLSGTLPFGGFREAGFLEILRVIKEDDPPKPSTRLASTDTTSAARNRRLDIRALIRELRGDLDWIIIKAMEKDRRRRYETANSLAADLGRFLDNDPVTARPPSAGYRLSRLLRKHRTGVLAGSIVVLALITGTVGATWGWIEAEEKRDAAQRLSEQLQTSTREAEAQRDTAQRAKAGAEAVTAFLSGMIGLINPDVSSDPNITARQILDSTARDIENAFRDQPLGEVEVRRVVGEAYFALGEPKLAIEHLNRALQILDAQQASSPRAVYDVLYPYLAALNEVGDARNWRVGIRTRDACFALIQTADAELGSRLRAAYRWRPGAELASPPTAIEAAVRRAERRLAPGDPLWAVIGDAALRCGRETSRRSPEVALKWIQNAREIYTRRAGLQASNLRVLGAQYDLVLTKRSAADYESSLRETLGSLRDTLPTGHWYIARVQASLGLHLLSRGLHSPAERELREAYTTFVAAGRGRTPLSHGALIGLVAANDALQRPAEADKYRPALLETLAKDPFYMTETALRAALGPELKDVADRLISIYVRGQTADESVTRLGEALAICRRRLRSGEPESTVAGRYLLEVVGDVVNVAPDRVPQPSHLIPAMEYAAGLLRAGASRYLANCLQFLGGQHKRSGNHEVAERYLREALRTLEESGFDDPKRRAYVRVGLGEVLRATGRTDEAERLIRLGYLAQADLSGEGNIGAGFAFLALVDLYFETGDVAKIVSTARARLLALRRDGGAALWLANVAWVVARNADLDAEAYAEALAAAREATALQPQARVYQRALGVALYRSGEYARAAETLRRTSDPVLSAVGETPLPAVSAFLAMALARLDRAEEARDALQRTRDLMRDRTDEEHRCCVAILAEAERVVAGR